MQFHVGCIKGALLAEEEELKPSSRTNLRPSYLYLVLFSAVFSAEIDEIQQKLLKIFFFYFKKLGQNLSVRALQNTDKNWNTGYHTALFTSRDLPAFCSLEVQIS